MKFTNEQQQSAGLFLLRALLGIIFLMQGFGKVFTYTVEGVYQNAFAEMESTWIPIFLLKLTAYFTSYMELIGGLLLTLGLMRQWAYLGLGLFLLLVSYGHGLSSPIWDLQHVFFRAALLIPLFMLPPQWDRWALDRLFFQSDAD